MPATIIGPDGRRIEPDDKVVPDGATVRVPLRFRDALSAGVPRHKLAKGETGHDLSYGVRRLFGNC